jgi:hypothetical protein
VSNGFNILKVNGSTHVQMLNRRDVKKSLIHSNINMGLKIVTCGLINCDKCKIQLLSNGFNMLKVNGSIHAPCW